jgi:hypothetical protein
MGPKMGPKGSSERCHWFPVGPPDGENRVRLRVGPGHGLGPAYPREPILVSYSLHCSCDVDPHIRKLT